MFCSLFGIPAIIASTKAKENYKVGKIFEAQQYASNAKQWNIIALIIIVAFTILSFLVKKKDLN